MKSKTLQIPLLTCLIFSLVGWGLASPLAPCNCSQHRFRVMEEPDHEPAHCCQPPVTPASADCPCGDDCHPAFQDQGRDVILSFYGNNVIPALESGRGLSLSFGSEPSESSFAAPFSSRHGPPAEPLYRRTKSLRC